MKHVIFIILSFIICQFAFAQNQPGLHVEQNHAVLFGQDMTSDGLKTMWLPSKGAFRSGNMTPAWDSLNIGNVSAAFGSYTQASGNYSFATGLGTTANSFAEFSIGQYSLTGGGVNAWVVGTDPVFEIGNGFSSSAKSNMLTVQKSGNVKIGDMTDASEVITEKLVVDGRIVVGDIPSNSTTAPVPGTVRWTGTDYEGWDGTDWVSLTGGTMGLPQATNTGEMLYWDGTAWLTVAAGNEGQVLGFVGGVPTWRTLLGAVILNEVHNPSTGRIWMNRNLGATQVATSSSDYASYGDLYQWGRGTDGHQIRTSGITDILSTTDQPVHGDFILAPNSPHDWRDGQNINLWQGVTGENNPCPSGYRIPTDAEWNQERLSWSSNDAAGAFASPLKLPLAGLRKYFINGSLNNVGTTGHYWSSTVSGSTARVLNVYHNYADFLSYDRAHGLAVRCLKD